jgi:hypothetical protein
MSFVTTIETFRSTGKTVFVTDDVPWFPFMQWPASIAPFRFCPA